MNLERKIHRDRAETSHWEVLFLPPGLHPNGRNETRKPSCPEQNPNHGYGVLECEIYDREVWQCSLLQTPPPTLIRG